MSYSCSVICLTHTAAVIHKYYLFKEPRRCFVQNAVDTTQQCGPRLIVEAHDDTCHR